MPHYVDHRRVRCLSDEELARLFRLTPCGYVAEIDRSEVERRLYSVCFRTDVEIDNDHIDTPTTTSTDWLFYLFFGPIAPGRANPENPAR